MRIIIKASGEKEPFDIKKFRKSLLRSGASEELIKKLSQEIEHRTDLITTRDIYRYALRYLAKKKPSTAARYNLKNALFQLGPSGFPFEKFLSKIFEAQGYTVLMNQTIAGICANHEVDLVLEKEHKHHFVESKFHNQQGIKSDIKITLYIQARFEDIEKYYMQDPRQRKKIHKAWAVTNTKFTLNAREYAECVHMNVIDWSYPSDSSLAVLIDILGIHPITTLTSLSGKQKKMLIEKGLILCKDVRQNVWALEEIGFSGNQIDRTIKESEETCFLQCQSSR